MLRDGYACYLAGEPHGGTARLAVTNKYTGGVATHVGQADRGLVEAALAAAAEALPTLRQWPAHRRRDALLHVMNGLQARAEEFAQALVVEVGKTLRDARGEVARAVDTFRVAAEEATRIGGEWLPLDNTPRAAGYEGLLRRFPIGVCGFITPFNFPLNLVAHKVAPAIAAGCPWVLKPASATPVSALLLGELLAECAFPAGTFSILPCRAADAAPLIEDPRVRLVSFTGSPEVGWGLQARAVGKRVTLELGGNAACIVDAGTNVEYAAQRITLGAFAGAGQSCISVQRVYAHRSLYDELRTRLVAQAQQLRIGDPSDEATGLGPLISEADARRVEQWVQQAVAAGARALCGGQRSNATYAATWLEDVDPAQRVSCQEVFGPVATLTPFDSFDAALAAANDSEYGLQCGVFTPLLAHALRAFDTLEVGGVIINDIPSFRVDSMPYGGVKRSGHGREGVRWAVEEMTEPRLLVMNRNVPGA